MASKYPDYHNRFDKAQRIEEIRFRSRRGLQSAELNEMQSMLIDRMDTLSASLYKDGSIIQGADCVVLPPATPEGNVLVREGRVYVKGGVYELPDTFFTLPMDEQVQIGIRLAKYEIDETDDVSLRNPAEGTRGFMEPGAARLKAEAHWGWVGETGSDSRSDWDFFAIHELDNGVLIIKVAPGIADPYVDLLAKYDREAHGNYVVDGFIAAFVEETDDDYLFNVDEGSADILGYKVGRHAGTRISLPKDADGRSVNNEPHIFSPDTQGDFFIYTNRSPISSVGEIIGTRRRTVTITHGNFSGASDPLPDDSVLQLIQVKQVTGSGTVIYTEDDDYILQANGVNWSPTGAEPDPGSTYEVTYNYLVAVTPNEVGSDYVRIRNLVSGTQVLIDYEYKLPRMDLLVLDDNGEIIRLKGVSQIRNPSSPIPAHNQIALATIEYDWVNPPVVRNVAIRAVKMDKLEAMQRDIFSLYQLIAIERLKSDSNARDPSSKLGVFVDPLIDDDMRDAGIAQTAAIVDGSVILPVMGSGHQTSNATELAKFQTLPFTLEPIVAQPDKTACMKINPYQAFEPIPARVTLEPNVDVFTIQKTEWASPITQEIITGAFQHKGNVPSERVGKTNKAGHAFLSIGGMWGAEQVTIQKSVSKTTESVAAEFIRQRTVSFNIEGFGPGETLTKVLFDGRDVTPA